jgi:hypothetical protein
MAKVELLHENNKPLIFLFTYIFSFSTKKSKECKFIIYVFPQEPRQDNMQHFHHLHRYVLYVTTGNDFLDHDHGLFVPIVKRTVERK